MAITEKTEPFRASLGEFAEIARAYGIGKPIREIAADTSEVSLSTLKKLVNGEHIRAKQFLAAARAFQVRPLDWIELKIRYAEAYLGEFLLGEDPDVFRRLDFENYPRTSALLIYSAENRDILP